MTLEQLSEVAAARGIEIDDVPMRELRAVSFPGGCIAMDRRKFASDAEYKCELAHEIGHCETGAFYNIHARNDVKCCCEYRANRHAAELLVPLDELRHALRYGLLPFHTLARIFDVTLEFIVMVFEVYEHEMCAPVHRGVTWLTARRHARRIY